MNQSNTQNNFQELLDKQMKLLIIDSVLFVVFVFLSILFACLQATALVQCCVALSASAIIFLIALMIAHLVRCIKYNKCISEQLQNEQSKHSKCPYYIDSNGKIYFGD